MRSPHIQFLPTNGKTFSLVSSFSTKKKRGLRLPVSPESLSPTSVLLTSNFYQPMGSPFSPFFVGKQGKRKVVYGSHPLRFFFPVGKERRLEYRDLGALETSTTGTHVHTEVGTPPLRMGCPHKCGWIYHGLGGRKPLEI